MSKARVKAGVAAKAKGGFIECELDESERTTCREWATDTSVVFNALQQAVDDKFTVKLAYDRSNECYTAYMSGHWQMNQPDKDWTLTGRGSTTYRALATVLYKHFEVLGGDWAEHKTSPSREVNWD
jgi:hypothetical protein